ncbi:MAG: NUDIX hydrolase [Candidatus Zixiibacteriota bacterium]|nr:MAG: NUDIX hydrolase [candidate division Zixibacteria bacterium]
MKKNDRAGKPRIPKVRRTWTRSPVTKVKESGKVYKRRKSVEWSTDGRDETPRRAPVGADLTKNIAKTYKYCPRCGAEMTEKIVDHHKRKVCPVCEYVFYHNPVPAAGVVIEEDGKILLVKRKFEPYKGDWCLPAGFMEYDESPERCAVRETKEELGVDVELDGLFGVYSGKDDPRTHAVLVMYWARVTGGKMKPGDDAEEIQFFAKKEIPDNIAFLAHRQIIKEFFEIRDSESRK